MLKFYRYRRCRQQIPWIIAVTLLIAISTTLEAAADTGPGPRSRHCAFAWNDTFYVFGGEGRSLNNAQSYFSSLDAPFDTTSLPLQWRDLPTPNIPAITAGACAVTQDGKLIVIGYPKNAPGTGAGIYIYDLVINNWVDNYFNPLANGTNVVAKLSTLYGPSAAVVGDYFFVFGGAANNVLRNEGYLLNLKTGFWEIVSPGSGIPPAMFWTAAGATNSSIYIFGGFVGTINGSVEQGRTKDIYSFNPTTKVWTNDSGTLDMGLADAATVFDGRNRFFLVPGTTSKGEHELDSKPRIFQIDTHITYIPSTINPSLALVPPNRQGHSITRMPGTNVFIMYGGSDIYDYPGDGIYVFDMEKISWTSYVPSVFPGKPRPNPTTASRNSPSIATSTETPSSPTLTASAIAGIGAGSAISVIVIAMLLFLVVRYKRKSSARNNNTNNPQIPEADVPWQPSGQEIYPLHEPPRYSSSLNYSSSSQYSPSRDTFLSSGDLNTYIPPRQRVPEAHDKAQQ